MIKIMIKFMIKIKIIFLFNNIFIFKYTLFSLFVIKNYIIFYNIKEKVSIFLRKYFKCSNFYLIRYFYSLFSLFLLLKIKLFFSTLRKKKSQFFYVSTLSI